MNPNYVHTITLYRRLQDGSYTHEIIEGCFWKASIVMTQSGTNASQANVYTVRIPKEKVPAGLSVSMNSDFVVLGKCPDEVSDDKGFRAAEVLLRHKPNAFKVTAFSDNTSHLVDKHYRLGG